MQHGLPTSVQTKNDRVISPFREVIILIRIIAKISNFNIMSLLKQNVDNYVTIV